MAPDEQVQSNVMRHQFRELTEAEKNNSTAVKDMGLTFWHFVDSLGNSRENSLAKTKIEEAVMWAVKGITG